MQGRPLTDGGQPAGDGKPLCMHSACPAISPSTTLCCHLPPPSSSCFLTQPRARYCSMPPPPLPMPPLLGLAEPLHCTGRNILWQLARKQPRRYRYYVFLGMSPLLHTWPTQGMGLVVDCWCVSPIVCCLSVADCGVSCGVVMCCFVVRPHCTDVQRWLGARGIPDVVCGPGCGKRFGREKPAFCVRS